MVFHAAARAAFFVDQVTQAPVVVQCVEAVSEPEWKWWLKLVADILGPLLSTAGSIYVAWRVFRWQGAKDHREWIRDQAKAEWSPILSSLTAADVKLPHVFPNIEWSSISDGMLQDLRNVLPAMRNAVFISEVLNNENLIDGFTTFVSSAAEKIRAIQDSTDTINGFGNGMEKIKQMNNRETRYRELYNEFHEQANKIRGIALQSLTSVGEGVGLSSLPEPDNALKPESSNDAPVRPSS
jgi:hypothetical protein